VRHFAELFRYEDGPLVSADWTILTGAPEVLDNSLGLAAGDTQAVAVVEEEMQGREHLARCDFKFSAAVAQVYVGLMVRAQIAANASPVALNKTYLIRIYGDGTLEVHSILAGAGSVLIGSGTVTFELDETHNFIVKCRDTKRGSAEILVFLDDEVTPVLTVTDYRPDRPDGLYVGFDICDTAGTSRVSMGEFFATILRSAVIKNPLPVPEIKTFGDLKYETAFRLDRGGDSQHDGNRIGEFLNHCQNEVFNAEGYWRWADRVFCFSTASGTRLYELPAWVSMVYDVVEQSNGRQLGRVNYQDVKRWDPANRRSGVPANFAEVGRGDNGGIVLAFDPIPGGQYGIEVPCYTKATPMVEDNDQPMIPPEFMEVLIFGALRRGFQYSDDEKGWKIAAGEFSAMLAKMRRANYRTPKGVLRMRTVNELVRTSDYHGLGPVTRAQQLGF
jgi:hypothetical protein